MWSEDTHTHRWNRLLILSTKFFFYILKFFVNDFFVARCIEWSCVIKSRLFIFVGFSSLFFPFYFILFIYFFISFFFVSTKKNCFFVREGFFCFIYLSTQKFISCVFFFFFLCSHIWRSLGRFFCLLTSLDPRLRVNCLTLCFRVSLLTDHALRPLFRSRRFSRAQLFVQSLHQSRQKGPSRHQSKMPKIRSLLWLPIHEQHRDSYTYIHIYIYIYIYIYIKAHYHATIWPVERGTYLIT